MREFLNEKKNGILIVDRFMAVLFREKAKSIQLDNFRKTAFFHAESLSSTMEIDSKLSRLRSESLRFPAFCQRKCLLFNID